MRGNTIPNSLETATNNIGQKYNGPEHWYQLYWSELIHNTIEFEQYFVTTVQGQMYRYGVDAGDTLIAETDDDCELSYNQNITIYGKDFTNIFVSDG